MSLTRRAVVPLSCLLLTAGAVDVAQAAGTTYDIVKTSKGYSAVPDDGTRRLDGTLKFVVESAARQLSDAGGGVVKFGAGTYDLGASWFELDRIDRVAFVGSGMDATLLRNSATASTDTEPFDVTYTVGMTVRDMSISAGGPDRSTSDALDFDAGNQVVIENVKVLDSRGRGIVFDGKGLEDGIAWTADDNVVRNCVVTNVPGDGLELLASRRTRVENCQVSRVGGHGIQLAKASSSAGQPHKKSSENTLIGNRIDRAGLDGINVSSGNDNRLLENVITNSGQAGSGHSGIRLMAAEGITAERTVVRGNVATDNQVTKTQSYGLDIASPDVKATHVEGNDFSGNKTAPLRDRGTGTVVVTGSDTTAPSAPAPVSATAVTSSQVDVAWGAASDDVGVVGYRVYRNGAAITTGDLPSTARSFSDTSAQPQTTYTYEVDAVDGAGNRSQKSVATTATTPSDNEGVTLTPVADTYVTDGSTTPAGGATTLRVDASPVVRSYLKFQVPTIAGDLRSAKLRLSARSSSSIGHQAHAVADVSWSEATMVYGNAPALGAAVGSSGSFASGYVDVDVTQLVRSGQLLSIGVSGESGTAISYGSRESASPPQLVLVYGLDESAPTAPTQVAASAPTPSRVDVTWAGSTDDNGVAGYGVYRDGQLLTNVDSDVRSYSDTTVLGGTSYSYTVDAVDVGGNRSVMSGAAEVTTPSETGSVTLAPTADAFVAADLATSNYGGSTTLRVDADPVTNAYLRFEVPSSATPVTSAVLRLHPLSSSSAGHRVHLVDPSAAPWAEGKLTYANAPSFGEPVGRSGSFAAGTYVDVDVTSLVAAGQPLDVAVSGTSSTRIAYSSREGTHPPQLVISY